MGEVGLEENPSLLRRVASRLSKLKNSALQLMPFISNTPADESPEVDLEAYGASTNHLHISNKLVCECQDDQKKLSNPIAQAFWEVELGKAFLSMVMPIATFILAVPKMKSSPTLISLTLCLIAAAVVFLYYGISLCNVSPKIANLLEQLGLLVYMPPSLWLLGPTFLPYLPGSH